MLTQMAIPTDRGSAGTEVLADEVIAAVHQSALAICEQQLRGAHGRLSSEQAETTRTVVSAIVGRLLAVPELRMSAAAERRDYADLLGHLFGV